MNGTLLIEADQTREMEILPAGSMVRWGARIHAEKQASKIVKEASEKAKNLLEQANSRARLLAKMAYKKGLEEAKKHVAADVAMAAKARAEAENNAWPALVQLAVSMAERIIRSELDTRPQLIEGICQDVLQRARGAERMVLQLNPGDLPLIAEKRHVLEQQLSGALSLEANESLAPGECRVFGDWGEIDAGLQVQLKNLTEAILGG